MTRPPIEGPGVAKVVPVGSARDQQEYCDLLTEMRSMYIAIGKWVVHLDRNPFPAMEVGAELFRDLFKLWWSGVSGVPRTVTDKWVGKWTWSEKGKAWFTELTKTGNVWGMSRFEDAGYLKCCVFIMRGMESVSVTGSRGDGYVNAANFGGSLSLGATSPAAGTGGTGASLGGGGSDLWVSNANAEVSARFQAAIVPLRELAEWFSERLNLPDIPTIAEIETAYIRKAISGSVYTCLLRLHNADNPVRRAITFSQETTLSITDAIAAFRRGIISESEMWDYLDRNGVVSNEVKGKLWRLSSALPGPSDLIRMMVRDAADERLVARFQMDAEFAEKWTGKLAEFGYGQGIDTEAARLYWRAHWDLPSLTQAFEMLHRLPPDDPAVKAAGLEVTEDDIKTLLAQNDTLPFWRDRLIAISYTPLTRVDSQRMFMTGAIDRGELVWAFRRIGYTPENAERLARFTERRRADFLRNLRPSRLYARGQLSARQWERAVERFRLSEQEKREIKSELIAEANARAIAACVKAYRQRFLSGEWDTETARVQLIDRGVSAEHAAIILDGWQCEKKQKPKEVTAATLCQWFDKGLIDNEEYKTRLVRIGYRDADAKKIVAACEGRILEREEREAARRRRAEKAESERGQKAEASSVARAERDRKRAEAERDRVGKAEATRKSKLRKAAETLAGILGGTLEDAASLLTDAALSSALEMGWSQAEAEGFVIAAAKSFPGPDAAKWRDWIIERMKGDRPLDYPEGE